MKKSVLIFSMVTMGFLLSSCLESGDRSYTGVMQFSYVTMDNSGLIYARNEGGFITSSDIKMLYPGSCYFLSYTWNSENGMTQSADGFNIFNVVLTAEPEPVPSTTLVMSDAPAEAGTPFYQFSDPYYSSDEYFGDFWAFSYRWKKKKGEEARVDFYKSSETTETPGEILIDVRLSKIGTPNETTETTETGVIAVNMKPLRNLLQTSGGTEAKNVPIRFRYYVEGKSEPIKSSSSYALTIYTD